MIAAPKLAKSRRYAHHLQIEQTMLEAYPEASRWCDVETVRMGLKAVGERSYRGRSAT
jgi:hypothetical protein